jgi:hypothetical protein
LSEVALARTGGPWQGSLEAARLPGAGAGTQSADALRAEVDHLLAGKTPTELETYNDAALADLGLATYVRREFFSSRVLTPRHQTVVVAAARRLSDVEHVEAVISAATLAPDDTRAFLQEAQAWMIAWYHREREPIVKLDLVGNMVPAFTRDTMVLLLPLDLLIWTRDTERAADALSFVADRERVAKRVIHVTGRVTPLAAERLRARGFEVHQAWRPGASR